MIVQIQHAKAYCERVKGHGWYISNISVEEGYRRQGIGTALMTKVVNKLGRPIYLYASTEYGSDIDGLESFYKKFGFEKISNIDRVNLRDFPYKVNMILDC